MLLLMFVHTQLDGVAMGSPLGPALANIFVGFHESRLFDNTGKPGVYFRFVNDTFAILLFFRIMTMIQVERIYVDFGMFMTTLSHTGFFLTPLKVRRL